MLSIGETRSRLAVDIEQKMLDYNKRELNKLRIVYRAAFILVFLCNAYHVEHHVDYWGLS